MQVTLYSLCICFYGHLNFVKYVVASSRFKRSRVRGIYVFLDVTRLFGVATELIKDTTVKYEKRRLAIAVIASATSVCGPAIAVITNATKVVSAYGLI